MSVRELTKMWMEQLPAGQPMIDREQLIFSSWPEWWVQWVEQGVISWIRESLTPPDIPLARMDTNEVREAWNAFEDVVIRHWALPANEMHPLLDELAEDLMDLLSRPAERIPDLLFGTEPSIDRAELATRLDRVVVHQDLARALLRYAERKELQRVDRELAGRVIAQVDQKLKERYDVEAWASQLTPLFQLWGGPVPAGMIRDLLNARGAEAAGRIPDTEERLSLEQVVDDLQKGPATEQSEPVTEDRSSLSDLYGSAEDQNQEEEPKEDSDGEELSLHRRFQFDEPDMNRYLEESEEEENDPGREGSEEEKEDENAIWKKFLAPDTVSQEADGYRESRDVEESFGEGGQKSGSDVGTDDPSPVGWLDPGAAKTGVETGQVVDDMEQWLGSDLDRFKNEIFDGSDEGLRAALRDLAGMENWGDAARYLQDDVFDRYRIDLFDEAAVDITDRMQAWFEGLDQSRS